MNATLYGVGVGPGDPELLTLKAIRILKECDYIAIPSTDRSTCVAYKIAQQAVPELDQKPILCVDMPMIKDKDLLSASHDAGASLLIDHLKQGHSIAFVNLGDPTIYASYIYLHKRVLANGFSAQIINGIPSFCACAATLNDSLVETNEPLHIYPASYPLDEMLTSSGTKVLMKSGRKYEEVRNLLQSSNSQVSMVQNCGMTDQKIYKGKENLPKDSSYFTLIIAKD